MTQRDDKVGILTDSGYSDIVYDSYEVDNTKCTFRLIRNYCKRARRVDESNLWHPALPSRFITIFYMIMKYNY